MSYCTAADVQKHGTAESAKITSPPTATLLLKRSGRLSDQV